MLMIPLKRDDTYVEGIICSIQKEWLEVALLT